jgi:hypothetical protein
MGILLDDASLLLNLYSRGTSFKRTLTLGRQQLFFEPKEFLPYLRSAGISGTRIQEFLITGFNGGVADPLFKLLGAEEFLAMDCSDYEGAKVIHDLNLPVPETLHRSFDLVFDGGTLEHVFHFPTALKNAMEMVQVGGALVSVTPMNNLVGHGFYQFSPELFYNVLSSVNGYRVDGMVAIELSPAHRHFSVADPSIVKSRVTLSNAWPVNLFVHAVRVEQRQMFQTVPYQTDYSVRWKADQGDVRQVAGDGLTSLGLLKKKLRALLSNFGPMLYWVATLARVFVNRRDGFENKKFFKRQR